MRQISDKEVTRLSTLVLALQDLVDKLKSQGAKVSPEAKARIDEHRASGVCLLCEQPLVSERDTRRGVMHQTCYVNVWNRIKRGETTEQQAVDEGIWNPWADRPGRKNPRLRKAKAKGKAKAAKALQIATAGTVGGTRKP